MTHVLFITEKYHSGPLFGLTNNMYNLIGSYSCANLGTYEQVFIDPEEIWSSHGVDEVLLNKQYQYDAAIISVYHQLPSRQVADKVGHKTIMFWWDAIVSMGGVQSWAPLVHQYCFDWGKGEELPNIFCVEIPQDTRIFYRDEKVEQDIDVSFVGSIDEPRSDRAILLQRLKDAGFNVFSGGGRGPNGDNFSIEEYASIFRRSKICLNLSYGHGRPQRKGRMFEIAACGSFSLVNNCQMLEGKDGRFFEPEVDYASFDDGNVIDRVRYFLDHPEERKVMSDSIYKRYQRDYLPMHFWQKVIDICS